MDRKVEDKSLLEKFVHDFVKALEKQGLRYIIVSGFVAIAHGRSRGTEDIDLILERVSREKFEKLFKELEKAGFECLQGKKPEGLYQYLEENLALRFVRKNEFLPEMEIKLAKDELDEKQLRERERLPMTGMPFWFSSIETNLAFKEELLKSPKDLEDARHLRIVYGKKVKEEKVEEIKRLIRKYRLK